MDLDPLLFIGSIPHCAEGYRRADATAIAGG